MKKSRNIDPEAQEIMDIFDWAFNKSIKPLQRLEQFQNLYDNIVNTDAWPTVSKIPVPLHFSTVEENLASAMEYLFPKYGFIRVVPRESKVSIDNVRKTERALMQTLTTRMCVQKSAYPIIKDCFKLGLGYGIVEPFFVSPGASSVKVVRRGGKEIARSRVMQVGKKQKSIRLRHITAGQIIVTPDGSDFNGPLAPSWRFFVDIYNEPSFNAMWSDGGDLMLGKAKSIVDEARELGFVSSTPIVDFVAALAGIDVRNDAREQRKKFPVHIPVIKCYTDNRHVWIANGRHIIFDQEDQYQTLRTPLIKASAWPEGHIWYPMTAVEAAQKLAIGLNVWINALFDLMTHIIKPTMLYNANVIKKPDRGPQSDIRVAGGVGDAATYLAPPEMPNGLFAVGDFLAQHYGNATGRKQFLQEMKPGMLRGGAYAFESLLQSSTGRERLAGAILETGFLQSVVEQTLIYMQLGIPQSGDTFMERRYNPSLREEYIEEMSVTEDDIIHAYDVVVDLKNKYKMSAIDQQSKMTEFQAMLNDPYVNQYELHRDFISDEERAERLLISQDEANAMQEQKQQIEMQAAAAQNQAAAGPQQPITQEVAATAAEEGI